MTTVSRCVRWALWAVVLVGLGLAPCAAADPTIQIASARFANLFDAGEAPVLRITVTADAADGLRGRLDVVATDGYGRRAGRVTRSIDLAPGAAASVDLRLRSRRPLGHFSVSARVRDGRRRTLVQGESTAAIVRPLEPSDAEDSAIGYFVQPEPGELPRAGEITDQMRRLGIRWVRLTFNWWQDSRLVRPDTSDPAWLDSELYERWVDAYRASGIEVLGVLFGTARWASSAPGDGTLSYGIPHWGLVEPESPDDWALFVRTLSERLRGKVRNWEVWNEPDTASFWQSQPDDFVSLVRATAEVLRDVDPGMRVGVNVVDRGTEAGLQFFDTLLTGAGDALDMFGLHYGADGWVADVLRLARPLLRPGAAIWNTEAWGAPRRHISQWLAQRAAGVEKIFPFIYRTRLDDGSVEAIWRFGRYPVNVDYTPRLDAVAFRTLSDMVGSATPVAAEEVGLGYQAFTFQTTSGPVVALADRNDPGETWSGPPGLALVLRIPDGVRRVAVVDLMGNREVLSVRRGRLRMRLFGMAAFLQAEPGASLSGLRAERVSAGRP